MAHKTPVLSDLGVVAELGNVRDLIVENPKGEQIRHRWSGARRSRPMLLWSLKQRALVWVDGGKPSRLKNGAPRTDGAAKVFEQFAEADAERHRTMPMPQGKMHALGRAVFVSYTEPWGRDASKPLWEHDLAPSDVAYATKAKGASVYAVTGPRITVNERGIVY